MATKRGMSRRELLSASIGIAGVGLLAACATQPLAAAHTTAAKPAEAPKPAVQAAADNEIKALAWSNEGTDALYSYSAWLFPLAGNSWYMPEYGKWFASDGTQGKEPPEAMRRMMAMWKQAFGVPGSEQIRLGKEIWKIACEELWYIGVVGQSGAVQGIMVAKTNMGNVPERFANVNLTWPPSIARPVTFYFK